MRRCTLEFLTKKWIFLIVPVTYCIMLAACAEHEVHFTEEPGFYVDSVLEPADVKVVLPQAGAVELIERHCVPCHSLRYIEMQPCMSHKSWQKLVDKMIKTYGAPIHDSETVERIVNYLWAIKKG